MCKKCGDKSCGSCSGNNSSSNTEALIAEMQDQLQEIATVTNFLKGHPVIIIDDPDDIASFDFGTGEGFDTWQGWAVCDGQSHMSTKKKVIQTFNYTDRFVVMAGGTYAVGDTGGVDSVTLTVPQIPAHDHTLTDPGHIHAINDSGHTHGLTQSPHTHPLVDPGHTHSLADHFHQLNPAVFSSDFNSGTGPFGPTAGALSTGTNYGGLNTNSVSQSIGSSNTGMSITSASISISVQSANTGIEIESEDTGITMSETGGSEAHENRPPYIAGVYIKFIG